MNWFEEWAKWQVIGGWVMLGLIGSLAVGFAVYLLILWLTTSYKKQHPNKWKYNFYTRQYDRIDNDK